MKDKISPKIAKIKICFPRDTVDVLWKAGGFS
jgi:hypothetical protein